MSHLRLTSCLLPLLLGVLTAIPAVRADDPSPEGFWRTKDKRFLIEVRPCGEGYCASLVGISRVKTRHDAHNADPGKRGRPLCGIDLVGGLRPARGQPGKWEGGWIYNPDDGRTYSSDVHLVDADTLRVRGYLLSGLVGRNIMLTREHAPADLCSPERLAISAPP